MHTWLQWAPIISDQELLHLDIYNWIENLSKFSFWNLQVLILPKISSIISLYSFDVYICLAGYLQQVYLGLLAHIQVAFILILHEQIFS